MWYIMTEIIGDKLFTLMLIILLFMGAVLFSDKIILTSIHKKHNLFFYILFMSVTAPLYLLIYYCNNIIVNNGFYLIKELDVIATAVSGLIGLIISIVFYRRNKKDKNRLNTIVYFGLSLLLRTPTLFL